MEIRDRELYKIKNGGEYETFEAYAEAGGIWGGIVAFGTIC